MIKRLIEISARPMHVSVRLEQLVLQPLDADKSEARSIPCEDIGVILIDHPQVTLTHPALASLAAHGAAVIICGRDHLPAGLLLPLSDHTEVVWRIQDQIAASLPAKKRLWQQLVIAKVRAQAAALPDESAARPFLLNLAAEVKSGDTTNVEAQAAKVYWASWLGDAPLVSSVTAGDFVGEIPASPRPNGDGILPAEKRRFQRDSDGLDPLNILLNYGYAIVRAAIGRALVSAGLFPALGLHHRNRSNSFALADDLIEPLRPMIDVRVRELFRRGADHLDQPTKANLLGVLHAPVMFDGQAGPLMVALHRYTASLTRCLQGADPALAIPVAI